MYPNLWTLFGLDLIWKLPKEIAVFQSKTQESEIRHSWLLSWEQFSVLTR